MDPVSALGLAASIITCIQLAQALLVCTKVGPSENNRVDLEHMLKTLRGFLASYEGLKSIAALDESEGRFYLIEQTREPLKECQAVIDEVNKRLKEKRFFDQWVRGSSWDRKINKCLSKFGDIKEQFHIAIQSNQLQIVIAAEKYAKEALCDTRDIKEDTRGIKEHVRDLKDDTRDIKQDFQVMRGDTRDIKHDTRGIMSYSQSIKMDTRKIDEHTRSVRNDMRDIRDTVNQQGSVFSNIKDGQEAANQEYRKDKFKSWLSTADPRTNHDSARKHFEPGTGSWFLQSTEYCSWKVSENSFLWIQGLSGCGKTILCSTIIHEMTEYCEHNANCFIAYYYFSFNDIEKQKATNLLRSIIAQLIHTIDADLDNIIDIYERVSAKVPCLQELKAILKTILMLDGTFYLVFDAVDECPRGQQEDSRKVVCETLQELSSWGCEHLHILITSRKEADIEELIIEIPTLSTVFIKNENVNLDIRRYIQTQMKNDTKLKKWSSEIKMEIETALTDRANGMFLWVFCQLDALKRCSTPAMIRKTLKGLPRTLHATYERILSSIHEDHRDIVTAALKWLTICIVGLTVEELAEAVAIGLDSKSSFNIDNRFRDPEELIVILGSLITLNTDNIEYNAPGEFSETGYNRRLSLVYTNLPFNAV
ncbi:hypothetical protein DSL72_009457 [Monilinia vaccinii-corymbosi]|uniref:Nephrocystin 3-like N-terminal domain-containing protein n=1 Tax=Monilinia vaccinii-corymbosi TaxID=61207 RepID=A0A8A3PR57_9HELO|nr:hypothetical protein DSL72_009457 [Monilinia vaccinii-corymbosi]